MDRQTTFEILELRRSVGRWAIAAQFSLGALIVVNMVATVISSVAPLASAWSGYLSRLYATSALLFTVELVARIWACTADSSNRYTQPIRGRIRYVLTPMTLLDIAAVLPFYFGLVIDLRFLRAFRLLRLLDFFGFGTTIESLAAVFYNERRALLGALLTTMLVLFVTSCLMYYVEHEAQPEHFKSILNALWWGLATFATIGYGDITPVTPVGRVLTGIAAVFGIAMFALPAGILASGYAAELKRRDFVITWELVAQVPIFARLSAVRIADIAGLLRVRQVRPGEVIVRKGDASNSMFFIADGEVLVCLPAHPVRLSSGEFFGEIGLLEHAPRMATVSAVRGSRLLVLDAHDLSRFLDGNPSVREVLTRTTAERLLQHQEKSVATQHSAAV
ncbi:MAG: cyclic nucleotide-binding domain-containing protein [Alphaproteobacteria bacterium]|nr:cyclic nucleotide-binding domain-containing protein [Alphaproteobacteria bacterium]